MQRLILEKLIEWKDNPYKKPLILRGIPQCGKTYLLKEFGAKCYKDVLYFDFEEDQQLVDLFEDNINPEKLIKNISLYSGKDIKPETSLIILDSIHTCSHAMDSLGYFNDDNRQYHVVAACSYMDAVIPNVDAITMYPMNFYEFLQAQNSVLAMHIKESAFTGDALKTFNTQLTELFNDYQIVGGMPEVVDCWINTKSIEMVEKLQSRIISGYENDFLKLAPVSMFPKLSAIWNAIPAQLAKENRKFFFSRVKKSWRAKDLEDALYRLIRAGLVYKVEHVEKPELPLSGSADHTHFKLYLCDVGLLRRTGRIPASIIIDKSNNYKDIKAALIENIVCCELKKIYEEDLFYWSAENPGRAEVEFVIQDGADIIPVAAKAGTASYTRSLMQYSMKFKPAKTVMTAMDNDRPDVLPLYAFWNLKEWISHHCTK